MGFIQAPRVEKIVNAKELILTDINVDWFKWLINEIGFNDVAIRTIYAILKSKNIYPDFQEWIRNKYPSAIFGNEYFNNGDILTDGKNKIIILYYKGVVYLIVFEGVNRGQTIGSAVCKDEKSINFSIISDIFGNADWSKNWSNLI